LAQSKRNMAKFLCLLALTGLAAGAPKALRVSSANGQDAVLSSILVTLQPQIDNAIARALGESTLTVTKTQKSVGPVAFSGSLGNGNYQGAYGSKQSSFTSSYGTSSGNANSASTAAKHSGSVAHGSRHFQTAGLGGVVYGDSESTQATQAAQAGQVSSFIGNQQSTNSFAQQGISSQSASVSASQQKNVVQGVMTALAPSIQAAVQAALLNLQQQQSTASTSTFTTGSQQTSGLSTSQVSGTSTVSASQQVSAAEEQSLVLRIIEVLKPSITTSVRRALASRIQTVQVVQRPVSVSQQSFGANQQLFGSNQQSSFGTSSSSSLNTQSSSASSSSSANSSRLVAQIIAALQPSIALSVQEALDASRVSSTQTISSQGFNSGFNSQAVNTGFNSQSSSSSGSSNLSSGSISSGSVSSGSLSAGSLSSIFGNGEVSNVKVQRPGFSYEYNTETK